MYRDDEDNEIKLSGIFLLAAFLLAAALILLEFAGLHIIHEVGNLIRWLGWA